MPEIHERLYRIRRTGGRHPSFSLERDGKDIGEFKFQNQHGSKSTVSLNGKTIHFSRRKGLKKDIAVHSSGVASPVASFKADMLSRGKLTMDGAEYRWAPLGRNWATWAWYDSSGKEIMRVSKKFHLFTENAEVYEFKNGLKEENRNILALLGWYLILLGQQDILQHLFVSMEIYLNKQLSRSY